MSRKASMILAEVKDEHIAQQLERALNEETTAALNELDPSINRALTRKFDLHIVPWLFGIWLFAFIDRSNIGNARIDGLATDLKLTGTQFNLSLMVFYIPYILVDVPSNWIVKKVGAGYYLPALITLWGLTRCVFPEKIELQTLLTYAKHMHWFCQITVGSPCSTIFSWSVRRWSTRRYRGIFGDVLSSP